MISAESVSKIQVKMTFSGNEVKTFTRLLRKETNNRKMFEPGVLEKVIAKSKELDDYFEILQFSAIEKKKK